MNDERLKHLLQSADADVPAVQLRQELLKRVGPRARRAAAVKIGVTTVLCVGLICLPFYLVRQGVPPIGVVAANMRASSTSTSIAPTFVSPALTADAGLKEQVAALDAEVKQHESAIWQIEQQESALRLNQRQAWEAEKSFEELTAMPRVAAQLMVDRADHLARDPASRADAMREYQRVMDLFSQTPQATVAEERLRGLRAQI